MRVQVVLRLLRTGWDTKDNPVGAAETLMWGKAPLIEINGIHHPFLDAVRLHWLPDAPRSDEEQDSSDQNHRDADDDSNACETGKDAKDHCEQPHRFAKGFE